MSGRGWADEPSSDDDPDTPGRLYYANVDEFVRMYLLPNWRRKPHNASWCSRWWEHAEAISRLEALWESWEKLRLEPGTGMATWWRDYADPHMAVLTDRDTGPFTKCDFTKSAHEIPQIWPRNSLPRGCSVTPTRNRPIDATTSRVTPAVSWSVFVDVAEEAGLLAQPLVGGQGFIVGAGISAGEG